MERLLRRRHHGVGLSKLALVVGWLMAGTAALANPSGGQVVRGSAVIDNAAPRTLNIFQSSERAIINWQSFGIGLGETVNFQQPSARSVMLNRVLGNDPTAIFGQLNANGTVMLVNPNGIVFGPTARVDVGGLVATTANIRNDDLMAGRFAFGEASTRQNAAVDNQGRISIRDSGLAALVAPQVRNSGVIEARLGRVALGAANHFSLDFHGDGLLSFGAGSAISQAPGGGGALVINSGDIRADGGKVLLTAQAVKGVIDQVIHTSGIVAATAVTGDGGRIVLSGGESGTVAISGKLDASSATGQGGTVVATGQHVAVGGTARIDVSGQRGGGEIALGSTGLSEATAKFGNKSSTLDVAAGAQLRADAVAAGDGGSITLWSRDRTVFAGSLSARGGAQGGNGGFAEVSSLKDIGLTGQADLRAPKGKSGLLLIDPTDLRITDAASGGSQDGNATDSNVAAGDANQGAGSTLNTVSRGLLEGLAGNANIVLQATGQITVDAMAGNRIDLATTAGHGFTLQSTQTGGIRFVDANTEIRTQGGAITLEAQGIGSTLSQIGRLTTNGGAVTLRATGDITLAGHINAGSGAVSAHSTAGAISNASGASPLLSGSSVTLNAGAGSLGASGSAIATQATQLNLTAGRGMQVANSAVLGDLSVTVAQAGDAAAAYSVNATGQSLSMAGGSSLTGTQVSSATPLNLSLTADRSIELASINVGGGSLAVSSRQGNLSGTASNSLTAGSVTLSAQGSSGTNGAIGSGSQAINTVTGTLSATAGSGGAAIANTGALNLTQLSTTGASSVSASGTLTAGHVDAGSATLSLSSTSGSLLDDGNTSTRIGAGSLNLTAGGAIGSSGARLSTNASTISANAAAGGIHASTSATSSVLSSITSGNGAIDIRTGGSTTLTSLTSSTSSASNDITVTATGVGSLSVGTVNAGALGDVTLTTTSGSISGNSGLITGDLVTLNAANSGSIAVRTAAAQLDVQAGSSSISITQTGSVTLNRIATPSTVASVTSSSGDITVGNVSTSTSGQVSLTASAGSILDDGNSTTRITTGTASLNASAAIGSASHAVQTQATGLALTSTGDLFVTNADATLNSLSITNRHATLGAVNTLQVTSPYLTFDVSDTGTQFNLDRLVGMPLSSLAFSGDQTLQIGQVQGAGSVSLTATQGHLVDDGNLNSRVTSGSTLTLSAAQGSVGSSSNPIGSNASALALTTRGDLYLSNLSDLSTLTVTANHPDTTTSYGMAITAPSLKLSVSDSVAGHAVHTLTDTSSLSLTFTGDRDITLGHVDLTHTGTARFTSSAGVIKDDGNKNTRVLANSTTLSGRALGATGADHLDVVTGTLAATASAGGVYVQVPMATGSTNTTSTVTLGTITATGPVAITALEGDLSLGGFMTATNQAVNLTATQGSILSPSGYSIAIGTGSLTLDAAQSIGTSSRPLPVTSSTGATLTAQAGTSMFASSSGPMTLSSLEAGTGITYTQSSGAITVGQVDATAGGTVAITATTGAIQNDNDAGTGIRANQVTLSAAQSSVGSGTAMAVDTPKLLVTANGDVGVSNSATLDTLSLTRGTGSTGGIALSGVAGQSFNITEDLSAHDVQAVSSTTPLAFSFSGQRDVKIGAIDVGAAGTASFSSTANLLKGSAPGAGIAAGTVSLTSGTAGSIGASGSGINLAGTTALTLSTGRNAFVTSDSALADLNITSTNTTTAAGTASVFGVSGLGQTFAITDNGTTQTLDFSGTALSNTRFTTRKNVQAGAITATGDVTLTTTGGGANSNISSDSGTGTIAGNRVLLTATSSTAGGGSIGSSGTALRVDTPTLILSGSGNVYVNDAQNLARLDMTLSHGTNTTFGYGVTAGNLNSFTVTDGSTQSLGLAVSGAMDFSYSVDRALSLATLDAGTSTTGSISLTSRSAPTGTGAQINRSSGSLTGGTITLSATGSNGGVGAGATLSTNTKNLSIATGGNVSVSNSTTLTSLSLDARHNTSGSSTHSYSVSSTGLTFSISDTVGNNAFQLSNITQNGLDLAVKADRVITASSVNTGAGGKVTLNSSSYVQGGSGASAGSQSIITGDLTLNGGSAFGYQGSTPLYTAATTLSSALSNTLYLSNLGALTLKTNTVGSSADVASSNSNLLQGAGGLFTTPTLKLNANQSMGSTGSLLTDARRLTLVARGNVDVSNASDLYALSLTSTHATAGVQNTISVAAPRLALALTDSVGGNQYHLSNLVDSTGLDFTLSTDVALNLGTVNAQAGRSLALYSTGTTTAITNDGSGLLTAGSITLSASGSVGAAGGSGTRMQTDALGVTVSTRANAFVDNAQDLSSLSLTSTQDPGGTAPIYQFSAPALTFDITDDGTTRINQVADSTGLNFSLSTVRSQALGAIDLGYSGSVSLVSGGAILGDVNSANRIRAASGTFSTSFGGELGSGGNPLRLSVPLVSMLPTGGLNVESDTHIDRLSISTTHPTANYGGTYSIISVPITGAAYPLFTATDSVTGTALTSLNDPLGLAFSFTSDGAMQVGTLNLGTTGTVALTGTGSGGILGDGDPNTLVQAASLSMVSYGGAVGATGSGNGIDVTANSVSATAQGGGVNLSLHGRTALGTIASTGGVNLNNDEGDIALGFIDAGGNAVGINNQGGSILSGSISNATTVALTASGSIGNTSAIGTSANGGGTTTLTASASAAHGASGSIAISESYNLFASSVTAPAAVTLSSGYGLLAGTVTSGGAVALSSSQGSINGSSGSNAITGTSVNLSASYGTGNGIGDSVVRLNVNTPQLVLNTPGSIYVTNSADLNQLTVDRTNYTGTGSSGTLSVIASGLTLSATDSSDITTLTSLADGTGLDFSYLGIGSLSIGSLNVGNTGSLLLQAYLSSGDGNINAINGSSLITAGNLTMQAYGTGSNIGSSGTPLGLAVGSLTASAGTGGMVLRQAGSLNLSSLATTGSLAVTASSGDLTLGTLSYGSAGTLNLAASGGSIFAGGGTLAGSGSNAAITLSAANGLGTELAPILINASAGHTVNASVTGTGSIHLNSLSSLNGGLTTSAQNGSTKVTSAGNIRLDSMSSLTDAPGNDIRVTASAGDITAVNVSGGVNASHNAIDLKASAGRILATGATTLQGHEVTLYGASGIGGAAQRLQASGQRVNVSSNSGAIYVGANTAAVLSNVSSNGGLIDIETSADLMLANASSAGGHIVVSGTANNVALTAGSINAGTGNVTLTASSTGGTVQDDGHTATRVSGATVTLHGAAGVGSSTRAVGTSAGNLVLTAGTPSTGIFVDDGNTGGVTLTSVTATGGAIDIRSAGPMLATSVTGGSTIGLSTLSGDLTVANVSTSTSSGTVNLAAAGSILASGSGPQISAHSLGMTAGASIGVVSDTSTGAGTPMRVNASNLSGLTSTGSNAVISVRNDNTAPLTLTNGLISMGSGGSAYLSSASDIGFAPGAFAVTGDVMLRSDGALVLPAAGLSATGRLALFGTTDISSDGAAPRVMTLAGNTISANSGAAGGASTFNTSAGSLDIALQGPAALTVNNTGTLTSTTLATSDGNISATSSTGMTAGSVTAGGANRSISLTTTSGPLTAGTINAGSAGTINLTASTGSLLTASSAFTGSTLNLSSGTAIGSSTAAFDATGMLVSAQVTGTGGLYLGSSGALTTGALSTADGDIAVTTAGNLNASGTLSAGQSGNTRLTSTGGNVTLAQAFNNAGADSSRSGLAVQGNSITLNAGSVSTSGAQSYQGAVALGANTSLTGSSVTLTHGADASAAGAQSLTIHGHLVTGAALGANQALASLAVSGSATLGGNVSTTAAQSYGGATTLVGNTTLSGVGVAFGGALDGTHDLTVNAGSGAASLAGAVGGTARLGALVINSSGATTLGGTLRAASLRTDGPGTLALNGSSVDTAGAQTYGERAVLGAHTSLTGSSIALSQGADASTAGGQGLAITGNAVFGAALGGSQSLSSLTVTGTSSLGGNVTTSGAQSYSGAVALGANTSLSGSSITLNQGADASATGAQSLNISGNLVTGAALGANQALAGLIVSGSATLGGNVTTTGAQTFGGATALLGNTTLSGVGVAFGGPLDGTRDLTINAGSGAASFGGDVGGTARLGALVINSSGTSTLGGTVRATSLRTDSAGTLALNGGSVDTSGAQTYGERAVLGAHSSLTGSSITLSGGADASTAGGQGLGITGNAVFGAALGANQSLSSLTVSGTTSLGGNVTTRAAQSYSGATTLAGNTTLTGVGVGLGGTLDGAHDLTVQAGSGAASFGGAVGGTTRLGALEVNSSGATTIGSTLRANSLRTDSAGTLALNGGSVDTTGAQTYGERAVLGADASLSGSTITLSAGADAGTAGIQGLSIAGNAITGAAMGTHQSLGSLLVSGTTSLGGNVSTSGTQTYRGATSLAGNTTLNSGGVAFDGSLDGAHDLTINAGSGAASLAGAVGGAARLGALVVNSQGATTLASTLRATSLRTDAAGTLAIHGGSVDTSGAQIYGERAVLGADTTLTGSTVTLSGGADASTAGAPSLNIVGNAVTGAPVGANAPLRSLAVTGTASLGGSISTGGVQTYNSAVTLSADSTLSAALGGITFGSTVDGPHALTLEVGASDIRFDHALGSNTRLGALVIRSSGETQLASPIRAASLLTDSLGTLVLASTVDTTGSQSYGERARLASDVALTGSTVVFTQGADATTAGAQGLQVTGHTVTGGALGANQALGSLVINGSSAIGGNVQTGGQQAYNGASTLTANATLTGASVLFGGGLNGAHALVVNSSGATRFDAPVQIASLSTDAAGSLALHAGIVTTTGSQSYGERAVLGADTALTGSTVTLNQGADATNPGGQALAIHGNAVLGGPLGANSALRSLALSGNTRLYAPVSTTGGQSYAGPVAVNGDISLHSTGGSLVFGSTIDSASAHPLNLRADSGAIDVAGDVGAQAALGALTLRAGTFTTFNGSVRAGQIAQSFGGGLTRFGGPVLVQGAAGLQLNGQSLQFDNAVTASTGGISLALTDPDSTLAFAPTSAVRAASGFSQTGGALVKLPTSLEVTAGPIDLQAPAERDSGRISLSTQGNISLAGLNAPNSVVRISSGSGSIAVGHGSGTPAQRLTVGWLEVPTAGSAQLFGSIGGSGGSIAASRISSLLFGAPYFMNDTPWGPIDIIATVTATTVAQSVVPSTPRAGALFTGAFERSAITPNALSVYASPQVLTITPMGPVALQTPPAARPARPTNAAPAGASTPNNPSQPVFVPTPGEERDDLDKAPQ